MTKRDTAQSILPGLGDDPGTARVRRSVDRQLSAQRKLGQLEDVDAGLVGVARTLADAMDAEVVDGGSRYTVGALAGRLVPVLLELRGGRDAGPLVGIDDELSVLVDAVRDAARSRQTDQG